MRLVPRRLVLVGTVLVDILVYLDRMPDPGGVGMARRSVVTAGAGYNVLAGAVRLGLPAAYAGLVGGGPFGRLVAGALEEIGVPVLLAPREADTGFGVGLVQLHSDQQPTFLGAPGVESTLGPGELRSIPLLPSDAVYLSGYDLVYPGQGEALASWVADLGPKHLLVFDPGPMVAQIAPDRLEAAVGRADILSLNLVEAAALVDQGRPPELAAGIAERVGAGGWVVLRGGARGCWVARRGERPRHVRARPTTAVDPTGAGDAHVAALLARLAAGASLPEAARWANVAASLAIERLGPATGPTAEELERALEADGLD